MGEHSVFFFFFFGWGRGNAVHSIPSLEARRLA